MVADMSRAARKPKRKLKKVNNVWRALGPPYIQGGYMKNKIYQWLWFKVVKKFILSDSKSTGFNRYHRELKTQMFLSKIFGGPEMVLLGDSEHGQFNNYSVMKNFHVLTLNLSVGGTTPAELFKYMMTKGHDIYLYLKYKSIIKMISTGGNCSLRCLMDEIPVSMADVHNLFPDSYIIIIPPVYVNILSKLYNIAGMYKPASKIVEELNIIREYQKNIWSSNIVDTYSVFVDPQTGGPIFGVLCDPVHFSRVAVDLIQKVYNIMRG